MKKSYRYSLSIILGICIFNQVKLGAQNYTFSPGKNFIFAMDTSQLNYNGIKITNTGTTDLDFTWELLLKDTLTDCEFDLCNSGICFNNLPEYGIMPTITPGAQGHIKLHMFSGQTNGINTIKYVLKNQALASSDTLTFVINVGTTTGLTNYNENNIKAVIYPNPTSDETRVFISLVDQSNVVVTVVNNIGQIVQQSTETLISGSNAVVIDTRNYVSGLYTIVIAFEKGSVSKKLFVSK